MASLAFSFPLIYSLGMGNPLGIVTLGIYVFWISRHRLIAPFLFSTSALLKFFPLAILPALMVRKQSKKLLSKVFIISIALIGLSLLLVPLESWSHYLNFTSENLGFQRSTNAAIHNQSFTAVITRFGIESKLFSNYYWLFAFLITLPTILVLKNNLPKTNQPISNLSLAILLLSFSLLLHPYAWQYYYTILLPFLILQILNKKYIYLPIYLLMSWNGDWLNLPLIQPLLVNSQFFATLFLFLVLTRFNSLTPKLMVKKAR